MAGIQRIGNVFYRVRDTDMDAAVRFYTEVLGLSLKFRDGNNWAAFDVGGATLALEGTTTPAAGATVSLRTEALSETVNALRAQGATITEIAEGAHERRATLTDPAGNQLILYEPTPR